MPNKIIWQPLGHQLPTPGLGNYLTHLRFFVCFNNIFPDIKTLFKILQNTLKREGENSPYIPITPSPTKYNGGPILVVNYRYHSKLISKDCSEASKLLLVKYL
ncbi:hypothetical protein KIL84_012967 [Mauremys mutica]|uniref:Uncharacterized protein n=1 Tax=Mauremys mutica TaxID=74926 RepID=A0A9D4B8U8_9SAUR|nr:hypothetical protein KIL84_012967 [Mauremys mutica]